MTRVSTTVLVILVLMNGSIGIMDASGLSSDLGIDLGTGVNESLNKSIEHATAGFNPGTGIGETLFGLFVSGLYFVQAIFEGVFAAPTMFMNLGFPEWFVVPLFAPLYIISALELLYAATGRDMT